jgi:hypothetical protein
MRRTRFISWLFLMLSLAFFLEPEFRQALLAPLAGISEVGGIPTPGRISDAKLHALARRAEERNDTLSLAFVAFHLPATDDAKIRRFADLAVSRDSSLTWIYLHLAYRYASRWQSADVAEEMRVWDTQLAAWDPENATPELLRAELMRQGGAATRPYRHDGEAASLVGLSKETDWRAAMERAFAKPRYDFYSVRRFELERRVLRDQHWDYPATMILYAEEWPVTDLFNIIDYANLLQRKLGPDAEGAGRIKEALAQYWTVAHFGERMRMGGRTQLEQLTGDTVQRGSYERLIPLLQKQGEHAEAATLAYDVARLRDESDAMTGRMPFGGTYNYHWSVLLINTCATLAMVFLLLTLLCVIYVNVKRRLRVEKRGKLWEVMTVGENYMPLLLFVPCVALYITYFPYAKNFSYYMTAHGHIENIDLLLYNSLPSYALPTRPAQLPLEDPFHGYVFGALAAILVSVLLALGGQWWEDRAEARKRPTTR